MTRYLHDLIKEDLAQKMVFIAGPRQVGKTTLARHIASDFKNHVYLSWDNREDRLQIRSSKWPGEPAVIVLDELHKFTKWKRYIKGEYDKHRDLHRFLVTGSARMDTYRKGGDSLQGRYHHYRLHPFSLSESENRVPVFKLFEKTGFEALPQENLDALLRFSGFPEPFLARSERAHRRWQKERVERFFREDVRDLENIRDLSSMEVLVELLPPRVGSPLSLNALREDLEVSHRAVTHWMMILERLYFLFSIKPFYKRTSVTLKKQPKVYLWDWSLVKSEGARFENLVASHLLKTCHYLEDTEGYRIQLHYIRDVQKREVDFLVAVDGKPWMAVEVKLSDTTPSADLHHFKKQFDIPFCYQVVRQSGVDFLKDGIRVLSANLFLSGLI